MPSTTSLNMDTVIGRLLVEQGFATDEEINSCAKLHRHLKDQGGAKSTTLVDLLIANGVVTRRQIERIKPRVEVQRASRQIPGFKIYKKLGSGAMATVFLAKQLSLDRMVAIKVLPPGSTDNEEFVKRFYAEGKAAGKLNHPNIVAALDVGQSGEFHYFVMEYVEGKTVSDELIARKRYTEEDALRIIIQVARALHHAHKAGFIHRDVKPKNIMITPQGVAKLADMGLARAVSDYKAAEAEQGRAFGTPYYIAPEQIRGELDVDFRADIYCLGATLYHMVTGRVPYEGANPSEVMHKHLRSVLVPPDHINPSLSAGVSEIIEVCMDKAPNRRYNTTADLLEDLEAVARGEIPMQARKKFDLASLVALDAPRGSNGTNTASGSRGLSALGGSGVSVASAGSSISMVEVAGNKVAGTAGQVEQVRVLHPVATTPIYQTPIFWVAIGGWVVALVMLVVLLSKVG